MKIKINRPKMQKFTIRDFEAQFPNDDVCLEWLKNYLYPNGIHCETCQKITPHFRVASRRSYSCQFCGHHVHPTADTIYHKSTTPLRLWFYAVYLMASTRCGISAKQLERELGVTYKTAWRMFKQIRTMLGEDQVLSGTVEVDETYAGPSFQRGRKGATLGKKIPIVGAVERGGPVTAKVVTDLKKKTLVPFIQDTVTEDSTVYTDENPSYVGIRFYGFKHERVNHSHFVWAKGDCHTNSIEGFWSLLKGGIRGVYKHVGRDYLQNYINEYSFRYNRRFDITPMFVSFMKQVEKKK